MSQKARPYRVQVRLDQAEYDALAEGAAAVGVSRSAFVRDAIRTTRTPDAAAATRVEVLDLLAEAARDGSVSAMTVLARELRLQPVEPEVADDEAETLAPVSELDLWRQWSEATG